MSHVRTQVRKAIAALLDSIGGVEVYQNLARKPSADELPVISVRTPLELSSRYSADEQTKRVLNIVVSIMANSREDEAPDLLDDLAVEIENLLDNTNLAGLLFDEPQLTGTDLEVFEEGADKIAFLHLRFSAEYHTAAGNPEAVD